MKLFDEIIYCLQKKGAENIRALSDDILDFDLYDVHWGLIYNTLEMRAELDCCVFDSDQWEEEDLSRDDVVDVTNVMSAQASPGAFYVEEDNKVNCRITFNFNNIVEFEFLLINALHKLLIFREAYLYVAEGSRIDAHTDWSFVYQQIERATYIHLKDYLKCNILYVHGFRSTGNSSTARNLRDLLPHCKVVSPDLPVNAEEAVALLKKICVNEKIDVVVGTSMGGMLAQKLRGMPKILVNPSFFVSETFKKNMGTVTYFKEREDGATEFEITPEIVESYAKIEKRQFSRLSPKEIAITVGAFGNDDKTVNCKDDYQEHYENLIYFAGGHRLDKDALKDRIIPAIAQLYRNTQRTWDRKYCPLWLTPTFKEKETPF